MLRGSALDIPHEAYIIVLLCEALLALFILFVVGATRARCRRPNTCAKRPAHLEAPGPDVQFWHASAPGQTSCEHEQAKRGDMQ